MNKKSKKFISLSKLLIYVILILGVFITVFPFIWMILTSFKNQSEAIRIPLKFFPSELRFSNYTDVFKKIPFGNM